MRGIKRCNVDTDADKKRQALDVEVARVFVDSNSTYGWRRVHAQLLRDGVECCDKSVTRSMRRQGLVSCHPAPWRAVTESDGSAAPEDLVGRDFTATRPGVRLVGDITQIDTWEGPLYLSTVIDLFSKEVAGWSFG